MGRRREDVEASSSPISSTISPPREGDGLSRIWPLPGVCYDAKVNGPQLVPRH